MRVLIGVDGSDGAFSAVRFAGRLLSAARDEVTLYYTPPDIRHAAGADVRPEIIDRARRALADAVFEQCRQHLSEPLWATVRTVVGSKNPREGVVLAADEWRADMIVLGARGSGPVAKLRIGSVARSVVLEATIPVLVVRAPLDAALQAPVRVLLAWDGSEASRQAAAVLERFHWPEGSEGHTITVVESLLAGDVPDWLEKKARDADAEAMAQAWVQEHEAEKQMQRNALSEYCRHLPKPFHDRRPLVVEGHAAERILEAIAAEKIDLVVLGAQGMGVIERFLIGSTSSTVLSQAPCSVLVVREHPRP